MPLACRQSSFSTWNLAVSLLMAVGTKLRSAPDGSYSTRKACRHDSLSLINLSSVNVPLIYISLWGWLRGGGGGRMDSFSFSSSSVLLFLLLLLLLFRGVWVVAIGSSCCFCCCCGLFVLVFHFLYLSYQTQGEHNILMCERIKTFKMPEQFHELETDAP